MYQHRIVIGDWSNDGHNQKEFFNFECSHDEKAIKKAYKKAVEKSLVSLHDYDNPKGVVPVCVRYEDHIIPPEEVQRLKELGVDFSSFDSEESEDGGLYCSGEDIAKLFFEMVKTQIKDFGYKQVEEKKPINGFWSKDFNHSFGYGCYN